MRQGMSPTKAAEEALLRIVKYYNKFEGALVAVNKDGEYGMLPFIFFYLIIEYFKKILWQLVKL